MSEPFFFTLASPPTLADISAWAQAKAPEGSDLSQPIKSVAPLDRAGSSALAFFENQKYLDDLTKTRAAACLVHPKFADRLPKGTVALVTAEPYRAFASVLARLYPAASRPGSEFGETGVSAAAHIHPTARLEVGVVVDPVAVIGPGVEIGSGSFIGAHASIGTGVRIGRDCSICAHVTLSNCLVGNRVILHPGVRAGQDGFGFAMGPQGHLKVPQIGRVIIQDDVEIGSNTTIDRGANRDTIIGEGTKIDNLVQIAHNVVIGRHCVITGQVGISGSTQLDDFVALGGQAGLAGHLKIGMGAQIAASSGVMTDIPAGGRWGGTPAQPMREFFREVATLRKIAAEYHNKSGS